MKLRLITLIGIVIFSCNTKPPLLHTLDFGSFRLKAPQEWNKFNEKGVDAHVGGLTNGKDTLWFYYGWYISGPKDEGAKTHLYCQDTINGLTSVIAIPKTNGKGIVELFIPYVTDNYKFALSGYNIKDTKMVLNIFKSVVFDDGDTSKNGTLTITKFREYPLGSGRTLYFGLCSYCHSLDRELVGPALTTTLNSKNVDWIYGFLKSKKPIIRNDSIINVSHQNIQWFDSLSHNDVQQLLGYIKGEK